MKQKLRRFFRIDVTRFILKIFWLFPIANKQVFFSAYEGKQYSCNPRVIFEDMCKNEEFKDFKFVWEFNNEKLNSMVSDSRVKFVKHNTLRYFYAVLVSKFIVTNSGITARLPLRKKQININTWHGGGAFKRVGFAINTDISGDLYELDLVSKQTTYFLSSSKIFTDVMMESIRLSEKNFVTSGMPRNDIFFNSCKCLKIREKILEQYKLDKENFLVLYAPTYRGVVGEDLWNVGDFPFVTLKEELEKKFKRKVIFMVRSHYFNKINQKSEEYIWVSEYPDMQDLLVAADMLITDYSSSIWDYALTGKPCILYVPDLDTYNQERGFYTNPTTWPGMLCKTKEDLRMVLSVYDEIEYKTKVIHYLKNANSYDYGNATKKVIELIKSEL